MPQAIKVLIAKFKPPFLTIMGKLRDIIVLHRPFVTIWKRKNILLVHYSVLALSQLEAQWGARQEPAFSSQDKAKVVRTKWKWWGRWPAGRSQHTMLFAQWSWQRVRNIGAWEKVICTKLLFILRFIKTSWVVFSYHAGPMIHRS